jgi:hypothetical protein
LNSALMACGSHAEIDNELNDHTPEDILPAKEDPSTVPEKSGAYTVG